MPAWSDSYIGVKIISVFPSNRHRSDGIPTINGNYMLMSGTDGRPLALLDGGELTARRTAAASVLAATWLARPDASKLLVVGSGRLAGNLARAYSSLFPISQVQFQPRRPWPSTPNNLRGPLDPFWRVISSSQTARAKTPTSPRARARISH
jgi:alanine dehydrogenase